MMTGEGPLQVFSKGGHEVAWTHAHTESVSILRESVRRLNGKAFFHLSYT